MTLDLFLRRTFAMLLGVPLLIGTGLAEAQDNNAQKAVAKAQFMLRQASAEKATLQQQVTDLQKQLDAANKQLASTKTSADARQQSLQQQLSATTSSARESQEKVGGDLRDARQKLRDSEDASRQLEQKLQDQTENFSLCYANNHKLYELNRELLAKYKDKDAMDALLQKEPFTGVSEVQIENLIQDYQYKLNDLKLPATSSEPSATAATINEISTMSGSKAANAP